MLIELILAAFMLVVGLVELEAGYFIASAAFALVFHVGRFVEALLMAEEEET
jgi:hypothetical protein